MDMHGYAFAEDGAITVYADKTTGFVNDKVFGNNFIGYDPMTIQDWAAERARNGHPRPYNVKYFEIGNEEWHGDHRNIKRVLPQEYGQRYLKYYEAL